MKLRGWLMLLLFAHVLLHPWVHAIGATTPVHDRVSASQPADLVTGDRCELCRVGHNATVTPRLPKTDLLNPRWIRVTLQAVNYDSLQADRRLPSRAPPTL